MSAESESIDQSARQGALRPALEALRTPVVLIGYRGTGKSTVARHLAEALNCDWVDADVELERRAGKSISQIFAEQGEPAFRDLESQVLAGLLRQERLIIAAGGGVVLRESNRELLRDSACVVWLQATAETIIQRVAGDSATAGRRPNLTAGGGADEVHQLLSERLPLYRRCANFSVDTEGREPREIAAEIVRRLQLSAGTHPA